MKRKKHIKYVVLLSIILAVAVMLIACGSVSSGPSNNDALSNSGILDNGDDTPTDNVQDSGNVQDNISDSATESTTTPPSTATPIPPTPPSASGILDYITIRGRQFSTELTWLNLERWHLEDYEIEPLRYMINLTSLDLNHNPISDLSPLAGLINLTELKLLDNTATDLTPLAGLINLTSLELSLRNFHDMDLTPIIGLTGLTRFRLSLGGNHIDDISPLADLTALTRLELWHNQISDLTPLAGLTNLRHLDLSGDNLVSDISPLANLTNLNTLFMHYRPGVDMSLLYNIPPRVSTPVAPVTPANPHPFADALAGFFVNLTTAEDWGMPYSYHAVLVDVDGRGTPGVVASRWAFDGDRHYPFAFDGFISIHPSFAQRLFFIYDNQLHEIDGQWGITPLGRLVALSFIGACDILMTEHILLDVNDGRLVGEKSISITDQTWGDNYYSVNYHINEFLAGDFEHSQSLTHAEFDELMDRYGLYGTTINLWELPDDTYRVLAMTSQ